MQARTTNFFVIGNAGETEVRRTAARLEQFREVVRSLFPAIKLDGDIRTNVVLFKDAAAYAPFKPKRPDGSIDTAVAGFFQAGEDVNYITLAAGERSAYGTIYHEYVHYLLDVNIGRTDLPPWLGEGLAEYFETLQFPDDHRVFVGAPPSGHISLLTKNQLIPLEELFLTDNSALHRGGDESRSLFYAQSWALTHFLLHSSRKEGIRLDEILSTLKNPGLKGDAANRFFGMDNASLNKKLRDHIDQPTLPTRTLALRQRTVSEIEMTVTRLSWPRAEAYLGDLLYHAGRLAEAEKLLRKSLAAESGLDIANISLGLVLAQKKSFAEAKSYLEKAIAGGPTNHLAYFNYAYCLSRESMDEGGNVSQFPPEAADRMRAALRRAIEINPGFAESYRLLAFIALVDNTGLDEAAGLLHKGLSLRPGDEHFKLVLAQVLLRQQKYDEAGTLAEKLSAAASDADIWAGARSVIHTVDQFRAATAAKADDAEVTKIFGPLPPLILKRSTLSDDEIARFEEDRIVNNLNILINKPRFGEKQAVGYVDKIACSDGAIRYSVRVGGEKLDLVSDGFGGIKLMVLTEGERSFTLDCGVSFAKQLTVVTFRPSAAAGSDARGRLLSIAFVPENFRLKTPREMSSTRTVIIEDDRVFKNRRVNAPKQNP